MTDRFHVVVHGKVQGVGFRWFAREHARRLQVVGWVRNNEDGTVEVVADGTADAIAEFRRVLALGPEGAQVVQLEDWRGAPAQPPADTFSILR